MCDNGITDKSCTTSR